MIDSKVRGWLEDYCCALQALIRFCGTSDFSLEHFERLKEIQLALYLDDQQKQEWPMKSLTTLTDEEVKHINTPGNIYR